MPLKWNSYAILREEKITIARKRERRNETWKEAKIANGDRMERTNATWKEAHMINGEEMDSANEKRRQTG